MMMSKKIISLLLASTLLVSVQMTNAASPALAAEMASSVNVDNLVDVTPNHWAYDAVKTVVQDLGIMSPKTATRFMGNDTTTRYEVAQAFYNTAKKLESSTGKDLKVTGDKRQVTLNDVDSNNSADVSSVVNEYGIMQAMPGNKFMGNEKMTRYELAFELNNYIALLIQKVGKSSLDPTNRADALTDVKEEHWATPAIKNIVNNTGIMTGYPDNTFKGYQTLTRYELAAVLRKFVDFVDKYLVPATVATPEPTAVPTIAPTEVPTPVPTETPVIPTKKPLSTFDLKIGGGVTTGYTDNTQKQLGLIYIPSAQLDLRFGAFQIGGNFDYSIYGKEFENFTKVPGLARIRGGADLGWRIFGNESDEDASLYIGIGYDYMSWSGTGYAYSNSGPRARAALEIPLGSFISIFGEDTFVYYPFQAAGFANNVQWRNEGFAGITIPAYTLFSVQLGYKDTRYVLTGNPQVYGDIGGIANLRFRF